MQELFRLEAESQAQSLTSGLLALESDPKAAVHLETCMRAAHSLKGAARLIGLSTAVGVAHVMEDTFVSAQNGTRHIGQADIDWLLAGVDLLTRIAEIPEVEVAAWTTEHQGEIDRFLQGVPAASQPSTPPAVSPVIAEAPPAVPSPQLLAQAAPPAGPPPQSTPSPERALRVTARNLDRLLGLASESMVESRTLKPLTNSLLTLRRLQQQTARTLEDLRGMLTQRGAADHALKLLTSANDQHAETQRILSERLTELEVFEARSTDLTRRLYEEVLGYRTRPFADGVGNFPKTARNLSRSLGKRVRLEIVGGSTQVDGDILAKFDTALSHLLHNAIDHGIESPAERERAGKPAEAVVRLEAQHGVGALQISVSDDGRGIDVEKIRQAIVQRGLSTALTAEELSEAELLEFLFLPGFSMKGTVTEVSGRGVGLDAVQTMVKALHGRIRVVSTMGSGTQFQLQLPLTLSVVRSLLVEIGRQPYAFPLIHVARSLKLARDAVWSIEGRQYFRFEGRPAALITGWQILGGSHDPDVQGELAIVVLQDGACEYGIVVDRFVDERELVVQSLDARFEKVQNVAAGALMKDGSPVLILDVADLLLSLDKLVRGDRVEHLPSAGERPFVLRKRVLVVDDSLTVRELERKLLDQRGFEVVTAVDGMEGWHTIRSGKFDLLVTDVDMPRMDGIELVKHIRADPRLKALPVMIVSYKDREEDRRRGLGAGADYYLTKSSFDDDTLVRSAVDLIGEPLG